MTAPDLDLTALHNKCAVLFLLHVLLDHTDTPLCTYLHTTHLACYLFAPPQASSSLNIHPLESSHTFYIAGFKQEPLLLCCNVKTSRNSEHLLSIHFLHLLPFVVCPSPLTESLSYSLQEMIIDKVNGHPVPRYLIYDIIKFNVSMRRYRLFLWFLLRKKCQVKMSGRIN